MGKIQKSKDFFFWGANLQKIRKEEKKNSWNRKFQENPLVFNLSLNLNFKFQVIRLDIAVGVKLLKINASDGGSWDQSTDWTGHRKRWRRLCMGSPKKRQLCWIPKGSTVGRVGGGDECHPVVNFHQANDAAMSCSQCNKVQVQTSNRWSDPPLICLLTSYVDAGPLAT
jgi:hypothetical protein